jgi:hypothetical protein
MARPDAIRLQAYLFELEEEIGLLTRHIALLEARLAEREGGIARPVASPGIGRSTPAPLGEAVDGRVARSGRSAADDPVLFRFAGPSPEPKPMKRPEGAPAGEADRSKD